MKRSEHWTATADRVSAGDHRILGEDSYGDLWLPSKKNNSRDPFYLWDRRFSLKNPTHWSYYLRSRITKRIAWLTDDYDY